MPDMTTGTLVERLVKLRNEHTVLIASSSRLLARGVTSHINKVTDRLDAIEEQAWQIAGQLYALGADDAAFAAVCGWALIVPLTTPVTGTTPTPATPPEHGTAADDPT
jgi:hypothetical protein